VTDGPDEFLAALGDEMAELEAVGFAIDYGVILGRLPDGRHQWMLLHEQRRPTVEAWAAIETHAEAILASRTYRQWLALHPDALRAFVILWGVKPPTETGCH
jgi:hypothetical protein